VSKHIIYTDHAGQHMKLRRISPAMVAAALDKPERSVPANDGDTRFIRTVNKREVRVVSHYLPDERAWLVVSTWVRGEDDPLPVWKRLLRWLFGRGNPHAHR
jgi:hypothetical protein